MNGGKMANLNLKERRQKLGISQEALAREVGISMGTINRLENTDCTPHPLTRQAIEAALDRLEKEVTL